MSEQERSFYAGSLHNVAQVHDLLGRLFRVAEPGAVYGEPIVAGERTVVITSELTISVGAGIGFGQSSEPASAGDHEAGADSAAATPAATPAPQRTDDYGGGGGGGGFAFGRPVAAVIIEPAGVRVEPIVDATKLGIAFFTTLGAMFFAWTSLRRTTSQLAARQVAAETRAAARLERASGRSARRAAKQAAKEARRAAKLAAKEAGQGARHVAELATKEAKKAAKDAAKDVARLASKQAAKQAAKHFA